MSEDPRKLSEEELKDAMKWLDIAQHRAILDYISYLQEEVERLGEENTRKDSALRSLGWVYARLQRQNSFDFEAEDGLTEQPPSHNQSQEERK
jgi:hypothetical protein